MIYSLRKLSDGAVSGTVNSDTIKPRDPSGSGMGVAVVEAGADGSDIEILVQGKLTSDQISWATLATIEPTADAATAVAVVLMPLMRMVFTATGATEGLGGWIQD